MDVLYFVEKDIIHCAGNKFVFDMRMDLKDIAKRQRIQVFKIIELDLLMRNALLK